MDSFDKDNLIGAAANLDAAGYLIQAIREDFITMYDPESNPEDRVKVAYCWSRYRALIWALDELLYLIRQDFKKYDIDPYSMPSPPPEKIQRIVRYFLLHHWAKGAFE